MFSELSADSVINNSLSLLHVLSTKFTLNLLAVLPALLAAQS